MDNELLNRLEKLSIHKKRLDGLRPFSPALLSKLKEYYDVDWTYNSNAIEGNTLTLGETRLVLLEGATIGGKKLKDHLETINHKKAIDFVEDIVQKKTPVTEELIQKIHGLILREIDDAHAGIYRVTQVYISGSRHTPPEPHSVPYSMAEFISKLNGRLQKADEHPVLVAADAHYEIAKIHPFIDGNGRLARLLMNLILMQNGYPPAVVPFSLREEYIKSLETANDGDRQPFYRLIIERAEDSLLRTLHAIAPA